MTTSSNRPNFEAYLEATTKSAQQIFLDKNPGLAEILDGFRDNSFIASLNDQLTRRGSLTENQVYAAKRFFARQQQATEYEQIKQPVTTGRRQITGTILSTRMNQYQVGYHRSVSSYKMLVMTDDHNKVWGSIPEELFEGNDMESLKGKRIQFTATVKVKPEDAFFGLFTRPVKASIIG